MKLFCISHAGGSSFSYSSWKKSVPKGIELQPMDISGHGMKLNKRLNKNIYENASELAKDISRSIAENEEYALFGHSLGAILAYEVYIELKKMNVDLPIHIFFSGRGNPSRADKVLFNELPDDQFIIGISDSYNGDIAEIMENDELRDIFLPILRNDFEMIENYKFKEEVVDCDISIMNGKQDKTISLLDEIAWRKLTNKKCFFSDYDGGHFYLYDPDNISEIFKQISERLLTGKNNNKY